MAALAQRQWLAPFFQLWFNDLEGFSRVHDKKLQILALCAITECDPAVIPAEVQNAFADVGRALIQCIRTLPEAITRRKEMEDLLGDGDDSDLDSDFSAGETQYIDGDDEDGIVLTEEHEYLELLAKRAAEGREDEFDDDDGDVLQEDTTFQTPLDEVNVWAKFRDVMQGLQTSRPPVYAALVSGWTPEDQQVAMEAVQRADQDPNGEDI